MKKTDFDGLLAGLEDALAYAKGQPNPGTRETAVEVDRTFVAATRLKAGLTQQEFARVTGASLGTVRKWERGERSPSGAARMLVRILARDPALVIAEAGLAEGRRKRRGGEAASTGRDVVDERAASAADAVARSQAWHRTDGLVDSLIAWRRGASQRATW